VGMAALGQCYATAAEAAAAVCAAYPSVMDRTGYVLCTGTTGDVLSTSVRTIAGAVSSSPTWQYVGPACTPATFPAPPFYVTPMDAGLMAAAVVSVWALAFVWRALRKALDDRGEV